MSIRYFISGLLLGVFLMVTDEIIATTYHGVTQYYFPPSSLHIGVNIWTAWEIAFGGILLSVLIAIPWRRKA